MWQCSTQSKTSVSLVIIFFPCWDKLLQSTSVKPTSWITYLGRGFFWTHLLCLLPSWLCLLCVGLGLFQYNCLFVFVAWPLYLYPNPLDLACLKCLNPWCLWASILGVASGYLFAKFCCLSEVFKLFGQFRIVAKHDSVNGTELELRCLWSSFSSVWYYLGAECSTQSWWLLLE